MRRIVQLDTSKKWNFGSSSAGPRGSRVVEIDGSNSKMGLFGFGASRVAASTGTRGELEQTVDKLKVYCSFVISMCLFCVVGGD